MLNRHFTFQNLIDAAILIGAIVVSSVVAYGQDTSTPQPPAPTPTPALSIEGPAEGKRDGFNDLTVIGHPADCTFDWLVFPFDHKLNLRESEKGKVLTVVGPPGQYMLIVSVSNGSAKQNAKHLLTIPGDVPTPPGPPRPPVVVKTLRDLAGPDATKVEKLHADMLEAIGKGLFDTVERFKEVYAAAVKDRGLENNLAVLECTKRLAVSTLDAVKSELVKITDELKTAPVPVPTVGKKHIVILRETLDDTPEQARAWNLLRTGENAAYIKSKGHRLEILDDDSVDQDGQPSKLVAELKPLATTLPFMFILEPSDGRPLHSQPAPATAAQVMEVIKSHGG